MTREIETWLSDSTVGNNTVVDHRCRQPVLSPLYNCVDRCHVCAKQAALIKAPLGCDLSGPEEPCVRSG